MSRKILHVYDLDDACDGQCEERRFTYPQDCDVQYTACSAGPLTSKLIAQCGRLGVESIWTFEKHDPASPRVRQWSLRAGARRPLFHWIPPDAFLRNGWAPDVTYNIIYQMKKHLGYTAYDVFVCTTHDERKKSLTAMGVHLV